MTTKPTVSPDVTGTTTSPVQTFASAVLVSVKAEPPSSALAACSALSNSSVTVTFCPSNWCVGLKVALVKVGNACDSVKVLVSVTSTLDALVPVTTTL